MIFWNFVTITTIMWTLFATITDIKTREVPNWISYTLIAIGLFSRLIYSLITKEASFVIYGMIGFGICLAIGLIMYYTKQWGGGDAKLLMGIGAMLGNYQAVNPFNPNLGIPFLLILIINIIVLGGIYGLVYGVILAFRHKREFKEEWKKSKHKYLKLGVIIAVVLLLTGLIFLRPLIYIISALALLMVLAILLLEIMKIVEKVCMYKAVSVVKLVEGDWLANDVKRGTKIIVKANKIELNKKDIILLIKNKIKTVIVKEGVPFVPGILLGLLASVIFGNWVF